MLYIYCCGLQKKKLQFEGVKNKYLLNYLYFCVRAVWNKHCERNTWNVSVKFINFLVSSQNHRFRAMLNGHILYTERWFFLCYKRALLTKLHRSRIFSDKFFCWSHSCIMCFPFVTGELEFQRHRSMVKVKQRTLSLFRMFLSDRIFLCHLFVTFCSIGARLGGLSSYIE